MCPSSQHALKTRGSRGPETSVGAAPFPLQPHGAQHVVHAGVGVQVFPEEVVSDENHGADAGLDGPFQPLDRLVDATEGSEGSGEVDMEDEFRAVRSSSSRSARQPKASSIRPARAN